MGKVAGAAGLWAMSILLCCGTYYVLSTWLVAKGVGLLYGAGPQATVESWMLGTPAVDVGDPPGPPPPVITLPAVTPPPITPSPEDCAQPWIWPIDPSQWANGITQGFHPGHPGVDISVKEGALVVATHCAQVEAARWSSVGYGNKIDLIGTDALTGVRYLTRYAHLSGYLVSEGQRVEMGQGIGLSGNTGHSTGPHLHFEIWVNGVPVDPVQFLDGIG